MTQHPRHSGSARRESRFRVKCPHCRSFARARSSDLLTDTYREIRFECVNDACGYIFVAGLEMLRTLCPSDTPNPDIHIPFAAGRPVADSEPAQTAAAG